MLKNDFFMTKMDQKQSILEISNNNLQIELKISQTSKLVKFTKTAIFMTKLDSGYKN